MPINSRGFARNFELANDINFYVLVAIAITVILGMAMARASTIISRQRAFSMSDRSPIHSLIGIASTLSGYILLVSMFIQTKWYWPVIIFVAGAGVSGFWLNQPRSAQLYKLSAVVGIAILATRGAILWSI